MSERTKVGVAIVSWCDRSFRLCRVGVQAVPNTWSMSITASSSFIREFRNSAPRSEPSVSGTVRAEKSADRKALAIRCISFVVQPRSRRPLE